MARAIALIILGIAIGIYGSSLYREKGDDEFVRAYPNVDLYSNCIEANDSEKRIFELTDELFSVAEQQNALWLGIGIQKFLASGITRRDKSNARKVCPPAGLYDSIGRSITDNNSLEARLEDYQLQVLQKIENPTPYITDKLETIAFSSSPYIETDPYSKDRIDLRPRARVILAQNKKSALKYAPRAYKEISSQNPLGTSAAQIAAKANYKDTLLVIERLLNKILDTTPPNEAIDFEARDRFMELSYALILAGEPAKKHTAPIEKILSRKVKSWAGHFGAIELKPKRMCLILDKINPDNEQTKKHEYCKDDAYPLAQ